MVQACCAKFLLKTLGCNSVNVISQYNFIKSSHAVPSCELLLGIPGSVAAEIVFIDGKATH